MNFPTRLPETKQLYRWLNQLLAASKASRIKPTDGHLVSVTPDGTHLRNDLAAGRGGSSVSGIKQMRIEDIPDGEDYLECKEWDSVEEDVIGDSMFVARLHKWRPSLVAESIDGINFSYVYSDANHRTSTDEDENSQNEALYPRQHIGDKIFAIKSQNDTGVEKDDDPVEWFDSTPRVWVRMYSE